MMWRVSASMALVKRHKLRAKDPGRRRVAPGRDEAVSQPADADVCDPCDGEKRTCSTSELRGAGEG